MDRTPTYRFQAKCSLLTRMHEWCKLDFRGVDEAEVEEDLEEVTDS